MARKKPKTRTVSYRENEVRYFCESCDVFVDDVGVLYECGNDDCAERFVRDEGDRACPNCNRPFSRRLENVACANCCGASTLRAYVEVFPPADF